MTTPIFGGALQRCDGIDNDCDDPGWPAMPADEADDDLDGQRICGGDCDDAAPSIYVGAPQLCDGTNNDCNDPGWPSLAGTNEVDDDGDTLSECAGDCDDTRASVLPRRSPDMRRDQAIVLQRSGLAVTGGNQRSRRRWGYALRVCRRLR